MYDEYKKYAVDVIEGRIIACDLVIKACKRYLGFFDKYDFNAEKCERVINFISKLKHFTGSHNNKPFVLLPYQKWIIYSIFGFYHKNSHRRVANYVYVELARKNGKTALMAAICLYMLIGDGESGSEVELVANSAKQAKICFNMCSNFLGSIDKKDKYFKRYRDSIKFDKTKSVLQVLSSDASGNDGYNSYCFCLDECHAQPDSRLWDVMCSSQGMRENPLAIIITTAGFNKFGFCYHYRETCTNILNGLIEDDSQFAAIYTLDEDDDWADSKNWIKANPSLGVTVLPQYLEQQVIKAKNNTSLEVGTRTKNFNQWVSSQDVWISNEIIKACSQKVNLKDYSEYIAYCGVDLAAVSDLTALSIMIPVEDKFIFKTFYYLPESCLYENSNSEMYKDWKLKGLIKITEGNVTDYDYILNDLLKIRDVENIYIQEVAYDQYNATQWAIDATEQNLPLKPYSQALWSFNKPTKEFERLIKQGKIIIDDNEITRFCFSNVSLKYDWNDNVKPIKTENQKKIDGVISKLECLGSYLQINKYDNSID